MSREKIKGLNYSVELIYIFYKLVVWGLLKAPEALKFLALNYGSLYFSEHLLLKFQTVLSKKVINS